MRGNEGAFFWRAPNTVIWPFVTNLGISAEKRLMMAGLFSHST